jgi:hypothetical protein
MSGQRSAGVDINGNAFVGREGIERRRSIVLDLHLRGMTNHAIAKILKVHRNTVTNDLKAIKRRQAEVVRNLDPDEETGAALDYYLKVRDQAYAQYLESTNANAKLGFLQAALRAQEMHVRLLVETGTIEKAPAKVASSHSGMIEHQHSAKLDGKTTDDLLQRRDALLGELGHRRN